MKKLIELHAAATPGPWTAHKEEYDSHEAMTADTGKAYGRGGHVLHYLVAGDKVFPALTGNGPTSKANAEYIAAVHDALPNMLALMEEAMHALLYIDAHMETERMPVAKKIAEAIGHPWPPYPDAKDEDDEEDYENPGAHGTPGGPDL